MKQKLFSAACGIVIGALFSTAAISESSALEGSTLPQRVKVVDEYVSPGIEAELSGIWAHPANDGRYYVLVNKRPPYRPGQHPMIDPKYGGSLITVDRDGTILNSVRVADDDFGGLVVVKGKFYASLTNGSEIVEFDPNTGEISRHIALPSPAGGLEYDPERNSFIAQLYVGYPHLAIADLASGRIQQNLWSEESAMGLAKVDGDWLCSWASGWDPGSVSELRIIDQNTGFVKDRMTLGQVHSAMAPILPERNSFLALVTTDSVSGKTAIRKYSYASDRTYSSAQH
jgi:hypothetical protein